MQSIRITAILIAFLYIISCAPAKPLNISETPKVSNNGLPDYGNMDYWAAHPEKKDMSDSVSLPLQASYHFNKEVDVFFIHPTTFTNRKDTGHNALIDDTALNNKTDKSSILFQASAFNQYPVYAPRYRQAHLRNYYIGDTVTAKKAFDLAYEDVKAAFQYYLDHYNHRRPIIIASHSQGTTHAKQLLKDFFEGKPLQQQLVAAYLIGMYIPNDFYSSIPVCSDSLSTGCTIAWRTFKDGYEPAYVKKEKINSIVVNPLTWTTSATYAGNELNKGGILRNFNKPTDKVVDASIHEGVLWIHKPDITGKFFLYIKNYHIGDINLFYMNIRENVDARVKAYFSKNAVK